MIRIQKAPRWRLPTELRHPLFRWSVRFGLRPSRQGSCGQIKKPRQFGPVFYFAVYLGLALLHWSMRQQAIKLIAPKTNYDASSKRTSRKSCCLGQNVFQRSFIGKCSDFANGRLAQSSTTLRVRGGRATLAN